MGHKMRPRSHPPAGPCMTRPTFAAISSVLVEKFKVEWRAAHPRIVPAANMLEAAEEAADLAGANP